MFETKTILLLAILVAAAKIEPWSFPWVLTGALVCGTAGGLFAGVRKKLPTVLEIVNEALSMGLFGISTSMGLYWWLHEDELIGFALICLSGICGLIGSDIFKPVEVLTKSIVETVGTLISPDTIINLFTSIKSRSEHESKHDDGPNPKANRKKNSDPGSPK